MPILIPSVYSGRKLMILRSNVPWFFLQKNQLLKSKSILKQNINLSLCHHITKWIFFQTLFWKLYTGENLTSGLYEPHRNDSRLTSRWLKDDFKIISTWLHGGFKVSLKQFRYVIMMVSRWHYFKIMPRWLMTSQWLKDDFEMTSSDFRMTSILL